MTVGELILVLIWGLCGVLAMLLALTDQKLQHPDKSWWDKDIFQVASEAFFLGPIGLGLASKWFIEDIKYFQSKKTWVLRKFEE